MQRTILSSPLKCYIQKNQKQGKINVDDYSGEFTMSTTINDCLQLTIASE